MVSAVVLGLLVEEPAFGNVYLATDDGLEFFLGALSFVLLVYVVVELLDTHHVTVVGDGDTLHTVGNGLVDEFGYGCLTIEDGVL